MIVDINKAFLWNIIILILITIPLSYGNVYFTVSNSDISSDTNQDMEPTHHEEIMQRKLHENPHRIIQEKVNVLAKKQNGQNDTKIGRRLFGSMHGPKLGREIVMEFCQNCYLPPEKNSDSKVHINVTN